MAAAHPPDVVILDLGLPDMDGAEVIAGLRGWTDVPILVLSGRTDSVDKVEALDAGADDYVTKPFGMDELLARLRAMTRRGGADEEQPVVELGDATVDLAARRVTRGRATTSASRRPSGTCSRCWSATRASCSASASCSTEVWGPGLRDRPGQPAPLHGPAPPQAGSRPVAPAPPAQRARHGLPLRTLTGEPDHAPASRNGIQRAGRTGHPAARGRPGGQRPGRTARGLGQTARRSGLAEVAREGANEVVDELRSLGVHHEGSVHLEPVPTWISQSGFDAERRTPGSSADAVVWAEVTQRAYEESELNWTYLSFMSLATLIAGIAIVLDSQILVIGAMVLGPEFVAVAALGLGLVRRRFSLSYFALRTLLVGFFVAIALTALAALAARAAGWVDRRGHHRAATADGIHLHTRQVVVHRGAHRGGRRSPVPDLGQGRRPVGGVHLGDDRPRRWERRPRPGLRTRYRGPGQRAAAPREPDRDGDRGMATLTFQQAVWGRMSARRARLMHRFRNAKGAP